MKAKSNLEIDFESTEDVKKIAKSVSVDDFDFGGPRLASNDHSRNAGSGDLCAGCLPEHVAERQQRGVVQSVATGTIAALVNRRCSDDRVAGVAAQDAPGRRDCFFLWQPVVGMVQP